MVECWFRLVYDKMRNSFKTTSQLGIPGCVHHLHGVVGASAVGMMLRRCALPGQRYLRFRKPARAGKLQVLAGDDRPGESHSRITRSSVRQKPPQKLRHEGPFVRSANSPGAPKHLASGIP